MLGRMKKISAGMAGVFTCVVLMGASGERADAHIAEQEGVVRLVATLQDNPAFTNVVWKVYRLEGTYHQIDMIPRHTATLTLRPGNYKAVALLDNKERSRSFQLKSNANEEIIIPMD